MMAIRRYILEITTVGPVHIGNGMRYGKKDYYANGNKIAVLDTRKFASRLNVQQMGRYCEFLKDANNKFDLQGFLKNNPDLAKIADGSVAYRIDSPLATARRGSIQYHDVWEFVKDPYGNPYIPGSSIKGMLRTAILLNILLDGKEYRALLDGALDKRRGADKVIMRKTLWKEQPDPCNQGVVNDILKYLSVADSSSLSTDDLVFVKKYDLFSKNDPADHKLNMRNLTLYEGNELDVYRECLRPGTNISVEIAIDERIDSYLNAPVLDDKGLCEVLQRQFDFYSSRFLSHFEQGQEESSVNDSSGDIQCRYVIQSGPLAGMRCRNHAVEGTGYCNKHMNEASAGRSANDAICYLGGGVDFMSKTVVSALFGSEEESVAAISRILFDQFPTRIDRSIYSGLPDRVSRAGFDSKPMKAIYNRKTERLSKGKVDHRHWRDSELGVSPHTMKWGIIGKRRYPMGKCTICIREA